MSDKTILNHINELVEQENKLRDAGTEAPDAAAQLRKVEEELDQCWDLLRQRRAKREFGENPDDASVRDAKVVENYEN